MEKIIMLPPHGCYHMEHDNNETHYNNNSYILKCLYRFFFLPMIVLFLTIIIGTLYVMRFLTIKQKLNYRIIYPI